MEKLLVAGILPGILVVAVLAVYSGWVGAKSNFNKIPFNANRAWKALWEFKWEAAIPVVLLGGMFTGVLRIHEASAFTAVYVLFIEVFVYKDISIRKDLPRVIVDSMTLVGAILIIMACGIGFTAWMIQAEIPTKLLDFLETLIHTKVLFIVSLNIFLIIVGMLMEIFTAIVVAVPLVLPLAAAYGLDPFHFAIIFLLNLEIAYLAPPMGINLFIASLRFGKPVTYLYGSVLTFIGILFATLMIVCYVPSIVTWLPNQLHIAEDINADTVKDDVLPDGADLGGIDLSDLDDDEDKKDGGVEDAGKKPDEGTGGEQAGAADKPGDEKVAEPAAKKPAAAKKKPPAAKPK
jgi:tripartite ATP-independent transporter DctM subunit